MIRRGSDWAGGPSAADLTAIGNSTPDGFTGHEMLDGVGLIHMSGRVYDPTVGRFLSVDPLVRDAAASQSWNGYGYVEGRLLSATDPSGWQTVDCPQCVRHRADPPRSAWVTSVGGYWIRDDGPAWRSDAGLDEVTINARTPMWVSTGFSWNGLQIVGMGRDPSGRDSPSQTVSESAAPAPQSSEPIEPENPSPRQQCLNESYGDSYAIAWDISPLSISSLLLDGVTEYVGDRLRQQANRNLYGDSVFSSRQYEVGRRQIRTLSQFSRFNAGTAFAGAGATGFLLGANISCTVLRND